MGICHRGIDPLRRADGTEDTDRAGTSASGLRGTGDRRRSVVFLEFSPAEDLALVLQHVDAQVPKLAEGRLAASISRTLTSIVT